MNINVLPRDPLLYLFSYLEPKDLAQMRLVNKRFRDLADTQRLYRPEDFKVKEALKDLNLVKKLEGRKNGFFGTFVTWITFPSGILSIITSFFCSLFPSIKAEIEARQQIENELNSHAKTKNSIALQAEYEDERSGYYCRRSYIRSLEQIMSLFGGKKSFESLPKLDIGEGKDIEKFASFIIPEEMTAPIMRGRDCNGQIFFTIRYELEGTQSRGCQTFYEWDFDCWHADKYQNTLLNVQLPISLVGWSSAGEYEFNKLAKIIKKGRNGNRIIK